MSDGALAAGSAGSWAQRLRFVLALVLTALAAAGFAVLFRAAMGAALGALYGGHDLLRGFARLPWWQRLALPTAGAALAGLASGRAARRGAGHGVGAVMEAVVLGQRSGLALRATLWKALGSLAASIGGGSIGREGPLVQSGAALGATLARALGVREERVGALVAAGTAAGFAAAYNTPIAAVLFVLEVVAGVFALELVLPVLFASAVASAVTRRFVGGGPIYGARAFGVAHDAELLAFALLGLLAGLVGAGFVALLDRCEARARRWPVARPVRAAAGGLAVGALALALPVVTGNGYEGIDRVLAGEVTAGLALVWLLAKAVATCASVSTGSPGGVFTPALFLGATLGSAFAAALRVALPAGAGAALAPGAYALVGMAAVSAATTHAPVMACALVFELTGDYHVVLPLLVATAAATRVAHALRRDSVYDEELARQGHAWEMTVQGRRSLEPEP